MIPDLAFSLCVILTSLLVNRTITAGPWFWTLILAFAALVIAGCGADLEAGSVIRVEVLAGIPETTAPPPTTTNTTTTIPATRSRVGPTTTTRPFNPACVNRTPEPSRDSIAEVELAARIETALEHPGFAGHDVSLSVWVDGWGEVITHNPHLELLPASNQKLLVAIAANETLDLTGPLRTQIELVDGDVVIRAGADPTLTFADLTEAFEAVVEHTGPDIDRIVVDVSQFPQPTTAEGWRETLVPMYVGPLSGFMVENNRWTSGEALNSDPATANILRLIELLPEQVMVNSVFVVDGESAPPPGELLVSIESAPIESLVRTMLVSSDNQHADLLLMELGRDGLSSGTLEDGAFVVERVLAAHCIPINGSIGDGSGLSRANFRSADAFVDALSTLHGTPEGDLLRSQMPIGGVSGTLARRFTGPYTGRVQAKTGTIRNSRALTGWAAMANGRDAVFSIIVNSDPDEEVPTIGPALGAIDALVREILNT